MEREPERQENGTYLFGEKSKVANWILNHPLLIAVVCTLISCFALIGDKAKLMVGLRILPATFFGIAFMLRFLCRNLCYWVVIDPASETITFFRCFNKGVVEAPIHSVQFVFDKHFACLYGGERFTIFNEYMHLISEVLPPGMEIKFSEGFYGRFMKKQVERNRRRDQRT
ncbi:MAG: hypothetical protein ACLQVJ_21635 [Syntrophobacteraceae bacterium]